MINLHNGDCLEIMKDIPDKSIDMILCDLPYGTTYCEWDTIINFDELWKQYKRILKPNGRAVLFGNQPFTSDLINSNINEYSHMWYWIKNTVSCALLAKLQPLRCVEDIIVFTVNNPNKNNKGCHTELRQYFFDELNKSGLKRSDIDKILNNQMSSHYFTWGEQFSIPSEKNYKKLQNETGCFYLPYEEIKTLFDNGKKETLRAIYNPQGIKELDKSKRRKGDKKK